MALRDHLVHDHPLGPGDAAAIEDADLRKQLFDSGNKLYRSFSKDKTYIIGRRGSGKTAFLQNTTLKGSASQFGRVDLQLHEAYGSLINQVNAPATGATFVENFAKAWEVYIWTEVFISLLQSTKVPLPLKTIIKGYLSAIGVDGDGKGFVEKALGEAAKAEGRIALVARMVQAMMEKEGFALVRERVTTLLKDNNAYVLIAIDSLEDYSPGKERLFLAGLFKFISLKTGPGKVLKARVCLPSELYLIIREKYSENPQKDFESYVMLHWHPKEIIQLINFRIHLFMKEHFPATSRLMEASADDSGVNYIEQLLPQTVINRNGVKERTIVYLLRHSQLLPRQFINLFNNLLSTKFEDLRDGDDVIGAVQSAISEAHVISCVNHSEASLFDEIKSAYSRVYPHLNRVLRATIPNLSRTFDDFDLKTCFRSKNISAIDSQYNDYDAFKSMLIEVGAIGVMDTDPHRSHLENYVRARFEYMMPSRLILPDNSPMCVHPIFSGGVGGELKPLRVRRKDPIANLRNRIVYPDCHDPEIGEYRTQFVG